MAILCAPEIDLTIKVWPRVDAFSSLSRINQGKPKNNPCWFFVSWKSFPSLALSGWRNSQRKSGCCSGLLRLNIGLMHRSQITSTGNWHFWSLQNVSLNFWQILMQASYPTRFSSCSIAIVGIFFIWGCWARLPADRLETCVCCKWQSSFNCCTRLKS